MKKTMATWTVTETVGDVSLMKPTRTVTCGLVLPRESEINQPNVKVPNSVVSSQFDETDANYYLRISITT